MRSIRVGLALSILACSSLAACVGSSNNPLVPDEDSGFFLNEDGGLSPFDANEPTDVTLPQRDSSRPEQDSSPVDSTLADGNPPDTSQADTSERDTNQPDAAIADSSQPDSAADANVADAGIADTSVADANVADTDVPDTNVPDANDAATTCISMVFDDHYVRTDGKLVYAPLNTVIVDEASHPLLGITEVVEQLGHACGLRSTDHTVWCWPLSNGAGNGNGDLGNGSTDETQAVGQASQVVTNPADAGAPVYLTNAQHLSTNSMTWYTYPTCAILGDQTVWCWGNSGAETGGPDGLFWGTTGSVASMPYAVKMIAGTDGGVNGAVPMMADKVSVGDRHACRLLAGKVECWGQNVAGNLGNGDTNLSFQQYPLPVVTGYGLPATVDAIGCGYDLTCALASGSVWCWGTNGADQSGDPSAPTNYCNLNYCEPAPTPVQQTLADGGSSQVPDAGVNQDPLTGATSLVVGYQYGCVLKASGDIWCWGSDSQGNLPEATHFTSMFVPYTNVTQLGAWGTEVVTGQRYFTAAGQFVSGNSVVTPYCQ